MNPTKQRLGTPQPRVSYLPAGRNLQLTPWETHPHVGSYTPTCQRAGYRASELQMPQETTRVAARYAKLETIIEQLVCGVTPATLDQRPRWPRHVARELALAATYATHYPQRADNG